MKTLPALLAAVLFTMPSFAEPSLGDAQAALKTQGFYFGEVSGQESAETTAALRRFQIRNGLQVTGKLNAETLATLGIGEVKAPAPTQPVPVQKSPPPAEEPTPPKRVREPMPEEAESPRPPTPVAPSTVPPPRAVSTAEHDNFSTFYQGTPYSNAPREVQVSTLRKAQSLLAKRGVYRGPLDGTPNATLSDALFAYQEQRRLKQTGRLDLSTLADLNLLPGGSPPTPLLKPFRDPRRFRDNSVERVR